MEIIQKPIDEWVEKNKNKYPNLREYDRFIIDSLRNELSNKTENQVAIVPIQMVTPFMSDTTGMTFWEIFSKDEYPTVWLRHIQKGEPSNVWELCGAYSIKDDDKWIKDWMDTNAGYFRDESKVAYDLAESMILHYIHNEQKRKKVII